MLLDVGCSWGRWSITASKEGLCASVFFDPPVGAVAAARRLAKRLGLPFHGVVADAPSCPVSRRILVQCAAAFFEIGCPDGFGKYSPRLAARWHVSGTDGFGARHPIGAAPDARGL